MATLSFDSTSREESIFIAIASCLLSIIREFLWIFECHSQDFLCSYFHPQKRPNRLHVTTVVK